ncbi:NnrU family protein [Pseudazoarcus pumilus]|uniref:NnrU family protein n=1 Tax=Pseudazoarcus pumilus TaxID=2067960 RepID=A0A2I6S7N6_9RHOO|nr:NnrU family protein [Pseudazoarcus pumilus]AUN95264.1 NnrU family protein [Pseudazoarcus pumilus]
MILLILGLWLFLGMHSVRMLAPQMRERYVYRFGPSNWRLIYAGVSVVGLVLIVLGYSDTHMNPVHLWSPPLWTRHLAALLTLPAFVLLAATYVPGTCMRARIGHPMLAATKLWALAHVIANGTLGDVLLFGSFLVWAAMGFSASRRLDRAEGVTRVPGHWTRDLIAVVVGLVMWFLFARHLHVVLFGVRPFG